MVVFRVTDNINIKTTDGTLVKYQKLKGPSNLLNETLYISTLEDFQDMKRVFSSVDQKYRAKVFDESKIRYLSQFPKELGILNINEYNITNNLNYKYKNDDLLIQSFKNFDSLYLNEEKVDLSKQIKGTLKQDIKILILGSPGFSLSEMICSCTALRIFYEKLSTYFKSVSLDIYLNASENRFYSRDKMLFSNQTFINKISALSIDVKEFCQYDFFVDTSSVSKRSYYESLNYTDAWLHKLGIDYKKIPQSKKYNQINLSTFKVRKDLKEKIQKIKLKGKILLYHPYSANIKKSIPKEVAAKLLKELVSKLPEYTIVSTIKVDSKFDDDRYVDLSNESKSFLDFSYIISNSSKVLTVNTSTYHIADAFLIPTVVIFTELDSKRKYSFYEMSKAIFVKDKTKSLSKFVFENDSLLLYKFEGWQELKVSKVIKLLESF